MKSAGQLSRLAGNLHITNTQGSLDPVSDHHAELGMAVIDQMFAETAAFHLQPTGLLDRLMERFRTISTDPDKCPGGKVSWKRNRNHLGRDLRAAATKVGMATSSGGSTAATAQPRTAAAARRAAAARKPRAAEVLPPRTARKM